MPNKQNPQKDFFLPDFCQAQSVFLLILIAEFLAVTFTLLNVQSQMSLWNLLGLYSISIQIITLCSASCLCLLRPYLSNFSDWLAGLLSLTIILSITFIFSLLVIRWYWLAEINLNHALQLHLIIKNLLVSGLIGSVVLRYFYLQHQYRSQLLLESSARLDALQARIRPHFLFNSMNVIASLTRIDPAKAESAIEDLSDLFRATLDNNQELIPFSDELQNSEKYLAIEKLRLADRLTIDKQIDEKALSVLVPPLSLQPLLENAVYHGIQMLADGGKVSIEAEMNDDLLVIKIANPKSQHKNRNGHGMALKNISQRLAVIYSGQADLSYQSSDTVYKVEMKIPQHKPEF